MKKILCYGDSNTFGYNSANGSRFSENERWTALLQNNLGSEYKVINEGACGRTAFVDDENEICPSALRHFPKIIAETKDIDILILAIGTNDLQFKYDVSFGQIENSLEKLVKTAKNYVKQIILIPPVVLTADVLKGSFSSQFNKTSIAKSEKVGEIYKKLSDSYRLNYFDFNEYTKPSQNDGLHFDKNGHKIIADKLSDYIRNFHILP